MSRQAAHQRFGRALEQEDAPGARILGPVTAFSEMEALRLAGRHGWHSVLRRIPAHPRRSSTHGSTADPRRRGRNAHPPRGGGWQVIGTWFPWVYLKRDTGTPALPEDSPPRPTRTREPGNRCATCRKPDGPTIGPWPTSSRTTDSGPPGTRCSGSPDEARGPYRAVHHTLRSMEPELAARARGRTSPAPSSTRASPSTSRARSGRSRSTSSRGSSRRDEWARRRGRASSSGSARSRRSSTTSTATAARGRDDGVIPRRLIATLAALPPRGRRHQARRTACASTSPAST